MPTRCRFGVDAVAAFPAALKRRDRCVCVCVFSDDQRFRSPPTVAPFSLQRSDTGLVSAVGFPCVARLSSACCNCAGNTRPRLLARRRIPCAAFALKKYFRSRGEGLSKMAERLVDIFGGGDEVNEVVNPVQFAK